MLGKNDTGTALNGTCTLNNMADVEHKSSIEDNVDMADIVLFSKSIDEEVDETNFFEIKQEHLDEEEKSLSHNRSGYEENRGSKLDQNNLSVEFCKVTMRFL